MLTMAIRVFAVLSKAGAIELVTQSNLGIANIMRGQYAEIYM